MWQREAKHCPLCSGDLRPALVVTRERLSCAECGFVLYENPASAAAAVTVNEAGMILLVRRAISPYRGCWALPAGYQEIDEEAEVTVCREVREETGIDCRVLGLLDLLFIADDPRKPGNVAVFLCEAVGGELAPGREEEDVGWFRLDDLPEPIGFDNSERILDRLAEPSRYPASSWDMLRRLLDRNCEE